MSIINNLQQLLSTIIAAEQQFTRAAGSVQLLAVSKTQGIAQIEQALNAGQTAFGENYVQEAVAKIVALRAAPISWHFIGAIQSNKTAAIAQHFAWVHSVASFAHAERLSAHRPVDAPPLNICIQVNVDEEATKAGVTLTALPALAQAIAQLPRLKLRGLMTIPAPRETFALQRQPFRQLRLALQALQAQGLPLDTLSMGMSQDYLAAIAEGATIIRVGTAIFGERTI